nr:helix-turn-helix transcriptional regulator [uncultured Gellertiella sp.]
MSLKRSPSTVDHYVGARVKMRRRLVGMSQERLAEQIGVAFQQVQKYEKGTNRIGASRLMRIAEVLGVPPAYFFQQEESEPGVSLEGVETYAVSKALSEFMASKEGLALNRAFGKITDADVRLKFVALVKTIADGQTANLTPVTDTTEDHTSGPN